jgi:hypothetical protein
VDYFLDLSEVLPTDLKGQADGEMLAGRMTKDKI